ncbi:hypothetical protein DENSPDRAFT_885893 [Dentipellis sp. KUC8613]|nr:hypothetical protein DENSPDRAFT_885893 [Dentipellis sp. KUC8613]
MSVSVRPRAFEPERDDSPEDKEEHLERTEAERVEYWVKEHRKRVVAASYSDSSDTRGTLACLQHCARQELRDALRDAGREGEGLSRYKEIQDDIVDSPPPSEHHSDVDEDQDSDHCSEDWSAKAMDNEEADWESEEDLPLQ